MEQRITKEKKDRGKRFPCGGWHTIQDIGDPRYDDIAKFAISELSKQSNLRLKFQTVVSGEYQIVCGINFMLVLSVIDGDDGGIKTYEAEVYEQAWLHSRILNYFKPVPLID